MYQATFVVKCQKKKVFDFFKLQKNCMKHLFRDFFRIHFLDIQSIKKKPRIPNEPKQNQVLSIYCPVTNERTDNAN